LLLSAALPAAASEVDVRVIVRLKDGATPPNSVSV
jgi:hypothetical protein